MSPIFVRSWCRSIQQRVARAGLGQLCAALCCWLLAFSPAAAQVGLLDALRNWATTTTTTPHPAIAKVFAYEQEAVGRGSGTLIQIAGEYGYVLTNWHVVRDAPQNVEVIFPNDFRSPATVLKTDERWDLALLVIRRPEIAPIPMAQRIPQVGDRLTIAGYGSDHFRAATGLCAQFVSPDPGAPFEMIEVAVAARQGDSGGPILNEAGELAAVLFGTGQGMTTGSHIGRVQQFLRDAQQELASQPAVTVNGASGPAVTAGPMVDLPPPFQFQPSASTTSNGPAEPLAAHINQGEIASHLQAFTRVETATTDGTESASQADSPPDGMIAAAPELPTNDGLPASAELQDVPADDTAPAFADTQLVDTPADDGLAESADDPAGGLVEQAGDIPADATGLPAQVTLRESTGPPHWPATAYPPHGSTGPYPAGPYPGGQYPGGHSGPPSQYGSDLNAITWSDLAGNTMYDKVKSVFALIGVVAVAYVLLHINPK